MPQRQNYLITNVEASSSDDDEKESRISETKEKLPNPLVEKLPAPKLSESLSSSHSKARSEGPGSVFANPFEKAEIAKQSILEKHVKMTEAQLLTGKKAKICKAFKQGRCRFGKNCKYSHDLDSNLSLRYKQDDSESDTSSNLSESSERPRNPNYPRLPPPPKQQQGFMGTVGTLHSGPKHVSTHRDRAHYVQQQNYMKSADNENDDDKFNVGDKRKQRVGLSQSLVPPKKAMSALTKQRMEERPWTVKK